MQSPQSLWEACWSNLLRAKVDKRHGFNSAAISTIGKMELSELGQLPAPFSRTVILRGVDQQAGSLLAYTDRRSRKIDQLAGSDQLMSWCFWDRKSATQFSGTGLVAFWDAQRAEKRFMELPKHSRKAYATLSAPGERREAGEDGLPTDWEAYDLKETDYAAENFCVLETYLLHVDILQLDRTGHRRMNASRTSKSEDWKLSWVTP